MIVMQAWLPIFGGKMGVLFCLYVTDGRTDPWADGEVPILSVDCSFNNRLASFEILCIELLFVQSQSSTVTLLRDIKYH